MWEEKCSPWDAPKGRFNMSVKWWAGTKFTHYKMRALSGQSVSDYHGSEVGSTNWTPLKFWEGMTHIRYLGPCLLYLFFV
jgi:hypothetical protein